MIVRLSRGVRPLALAFAPGVDVLQLILTGIFCYIFLAVRPTSVVSGAVFDHHHHHMCTGDEYSA